MFLIRTFLFIFVWKYAESSSGDCTTPDSKKGQCVSLKACPAMIYFLNNAPKPFSDEVTKLLNKYVCSYGDEAINTEVCCPSEPININGTDPTEVSPPPPPEVSNHKNIKLLPEDGVIDSADKIRGGMDAIMYACLTDIIVQSSSGDCTTPDNKKGQCVSLEACPAMIYFLNNSPKPFSNEVIKLLNKYVCSYGDEAIDTEVCCPSEPINIGGTDPAEVPPPPPPEVLNHKNIKLLPEECGLIDSDDKIRGGMDASLREFPWMAVLSYRTDDGPQFKCGGSIINERYILTAAHCIVATPFPLASIRVGEYSLLSENDCEPNHPDRCLPPPQDLTFEDIIPHPEYNTTSFVNDIALIRVSKINMDGENIQAICLPVYEDVVTQEFENGLVTGWGFTDPYGANVIDKLQKVSLKKRNLTTCINAYKVQPSIKLTYKQICVGGEGVKDSCGGDSGGPFHVAAHFNDEDRYVQRGVVSIGHRFCGTAGFPGVFTNVAYYAKWILDTLKP